MFFVVYASWIRCLARWIGRSVFGKKRPRYSLTMASRQLHLLDGIERQLGQGKGAKGKKSRSGNKLSSDANRVGTNADTGSASDIAVAQALPCASADSVIPPTEVPSALPMAATQADFQQLQK